ncbi:hypothetical protein QJS04_geneDACA004679 [Acorus gramineus]|uniref:Uncharacterized protein n=1 Tax=Acorus gramineus TaxID=55184 RepID=A0AAV9BWT9_ACOGR|nr:hypothetical protein QJS04_geneDACA004679 [Acorus gramineus]
MKPVSGFTGSSNSISLKRSSAVLSRFMSSETRTSNEVSAYLRRASDAFEELLDFHDRLMEGSDRRSRRRRRRTSSEAEEGGEGLGS